MVPAYMVWNVEPAASQGFMFGGLLLGLLFGLITCFKASWAPVTGPIYAIAEGCFLGAISRYFNEAYPGIAVQAMSLTFGTMFAMLILYRTGVIKATRKFRAVVLAAGSAIFLVYMVNLILYLFGSSIPFIHDTERSASRSARSWWWWRLCFSFSISISSRRAHVQAPPSTWSGMAPSG